MIFGKKAMDWYNEGMKLLRDRKTEKAIECFKKAYDESNNVEKGENPQRVKAIALDGMGLAFALETKYEDALTCFEKSLSLILAEKGIDRDPLSEDKEVPDVIWSKITIDPLAYTCYGDKAMALKDFAVNKGRDRFDELIQQSRKIIDKLLESIPAHPPQIETASRLARVRYDLVFMLAQFRHPEAFHEAEEGIIVEVDTIKATYQELGYTENAMKFDFERAGIKQKP